MKHDEPWLGPMRNFRIKHFLVHVGFDFVARSVFGYVEIFFSFISAGRCIVLSASDLDITEVSLEGSGNEFDYTNDGRNLTLNLKGPIPEDVPIKLRIAYRAIPKAGMYFQQHSNGSDVYYVCTHGEGGLHSNWVPIYTGNDLKFTTEVIMDVPEGLKALSNGDLLKVSDIKQGYKSWHWLQDKPHCSYLITLNVGDFEQVSFPNAMGTIPVSAWVPQGNSETALHAFQATSAQIEYYSKLFDFHFPWCKYDQVIQPNFPTVGGVEHTSITTFSLIPLRGKGDALDSEGPMFDTYHSVWVQETYLAHELIHQWFGNLVTARSMEHIWLNEGFATYLMHLWTEHTIGVEQFVFDIEAMRKDYLDYVRENGTRPVQFSDYRTAGEALNYRHAYYKPALVLHMLRRLIGDDLFFKGLRHYLKENAYSSVVGEVFLQTFEDATGWDLGWFYRQWILGDGHPNLEISYKYLPQLGGVDLKVVQRSGTFRVPLRITLDDEAGSGAIYWVHEREQHFFIRSKAEPKMVSIDNQGDLLAEFIFLKRREELIYQAQNDSVLGRTFALRQLGARYKHQGPSLLVCEKVFRHSSFWPLRAEAVLSAGGSHEPEAVALTFAAMEDPEYRVRKAALMCLASVSGPASRSRLIQAVEEEHHENVVGTAIFCLALSGYTPDLHFFARQLVRSSWLDTIRMATLRALALIGHSDWVSFVVPFTKVGFNYWVRDAAFRAWASCQPDHPGLVAELIEAAIGPPPLQYTALELLEELVPSEATKVLKILADQMGAPDVAAMAKSAVTRLERIQNERTP